MRQSGSLRRRTSRECTSTVPARQGATDLAATQIGAVEAEPADSRILSEPGILPTGEPSRGLHRTEASLLLADLPGQERQHLPVTEGPRGGPPGAETSFGQTFDLRDETLPPHPCHPLLDPRVECGAVDVQTDLKHLRQGVDRIRQLGGERPAGELDDLQGPDDAAPVVRQDSGRGGRIDSGQPVVQRCRTEGVQIGFQLASDRWIGTRKVEAVDDRPNVQRGPADNDRDRASCGDLGDALPGHRLELSHAGRLLDLQDVDQVMPNGRPLGRRRLRRTDVHATVDRHRVGADDLGRPAGRLQTLRQRHGESRLADRSRPDHDGDHADSLSILD